MNNLYTFGLFAIVLFMLTSCNKDNTFVNTVDNDFGFENKSEIVIFEGFHDSDFAEKDSKKLMFFNTVRNDLIVRPEQLYFEMFEALRSRNLRKLNNVLILLKPLMAEIDTFQHICLESLLQQHLAEKDFKALQKDLVLLVVCSVESLLKTSAFQKNTASKKHLIRQTFVEFLEIKTPLKKIDPVLSAKVVENLRTAFSHSMTAHQYDNDVHNIQDSLNLLKAKLWA